MEIGIAWREGNSAFAGFIGTLELDDL
jgi:hypothetical protein